MFKYNNQFKMTPPATIEHEGFVRKFSELTREQWDEAGYNEAFPIDREPFTTYETQWIKGDDLIYREEVISTAEDVQARQAHESIQLRNERDRRLTATDWTQLKDTGLDDADLVLWQSYRQALRDVPQQDGFPDAVIWPEEPEKE